jgi:hypothetical protein
MDIYPRDESLRFPLNFNLTQSKNKSCVKI